MILSKFAKLQTFSFILSQILRDEQLGLYCSGKGQVGPKKLLLWFAYHLKVRIIQKLNKISIFKKSWNYEKFFFLIRWTFLQISWPINKKR